MSVDETMKQRVVEILSSQCANDERIRRAWTGSSDFKILGVENVTRMSVSIQARKRESRKEREAAAEPWTPKSEPWSISLWKDYLADDWAEYSWEHVDDFWEECSECHNHPSSECPDCNGTGRKRCSKCDGDGEVVVTV